MVDYRQVTYATERRSSLNVVSIIQQRPDFSADELAGKMIVQKPDGINGGH